LRSTLKSSYYNHYTAAGDSDRAIVFNKFWGSIAVFDQAFVDSLTSGALDVLPDDVLAEMEQAGFLVPADMDEIDTAHSLYVNRRANNSVLNITMELTQECNLACTFCYQNSYRAEGAITSAGIGTVIAYIDTVLTDRKRPITDVVFRLIGGEPLMQKAKVLEAVERGTELAARHGVQFHPQIDTNGLLLDESVIKALRSISITITNKADHDKVRIRHNGGGSYGQIVNRLRRHAQHFNEYGTILSIRFNANALNAKYVPEVYRMTKGLGIDRAEFELYNTVNYSYNLLTPGLSRDQFKRLYMELLVLKVEHGEIITDFPRPTFTPCSAYTPYNVKFTADGKLAACDAMHTARGSADDLVADVDRHSEIFADVAAHDPFNHPQCGKCPNVGICGGMLFCKTNPHVPTMIRATSCRSIWTSSYGFS